MTRTGSRASWGVAACALLLSLSACGGSSAPPPEPPVPVGRGSPVGSPSALAIDASGGNFASSDGRLTVSVPAGAVTASTDFTIQVITNTAPSGVGNAFRITIDPQVAFAAPVALVFSPGPSAPPLAELSVATQETRPDGTGYWVRLAETRIVRNATAGTLTVTTNDLGDWAIVGAPTGRDLIGLFRVESTLDDTHVVANGRTSLNFHAGDGSTAYYVQWGWITAESPVQSGALACTPDVPTAGLNVNVAEVVPDPTRFRWAATGDWTLTCPGPETAYAHVLFDTMGIYHLSCARGYTATPVISSDLITGDYAIDCGLDGGVTASWRFEKCDAGAPCTSANPCHTAAITCDTGLPLCVDDGNVPNGTLCDLVPSVHEVCGDGVCNTCRLDADCDPANVCNLGRYTCDTGFEVCADLGLPDASMTGVTCDVDPSLPEVCGNGTCNVCRAGVDCDPANVCNLGWYTCGTGFEVCTDRLLPDPSMTGVTCDVNPLEPEVCGGGTCNVCRAGEACSTNPNPCVAGAISCTTGHPACVDTATPIANGTACGTNQVCYQSACVACTANQPCTENPDLCLTGLTSCATGQSVCLDNPALPELPGTTCGTNQVCNGSGGCIACTLGEVCIPSVCNTGAIECITGAPVCVNTGNVPNGTSCGPDQVCGDGVCNACVLDAACVPPLGPDSPCNTGNVECSSGFPVCLDTGNVANGTSCGTDQVCNDGDCNLCAAGVPCTTNPNPCVDGTTSCASGTSVCVDTAVAKANGTSCGTNLVCYQSACVACTANEACLDAPNPCLTGLISCATGQPVCLDNAAAPEPAGATCGTDQVCDGSGVCVACVQNAPCTPSICNTGNVACSSGAPVCVDTGDVASGTSCGADQVCNGGSCVACVAGAGCPTNSNPCVAGVTSCATGSSVCVDTATPLANGTTCGADQVCNGGNCVACTAGAACTGNANPCLAGVTSCATGSSICVDSAVQKPDGTSCGTDLVCSAGACSTCTAGVACAGNPNACVEGVTSCSTGVSVCVDTAVPKANGTTCGTDQVCSGGSCAACVAGAACATNLSPCLVGITSCATGTSVCVDTATPLPNGTSCGTGAVCNGGVCTACTAGFACDTNPNPCLAGVTDCSTGVELCLDTATPLADGTGCGTNLVCDAGVCTACTAGAACATNPDPCLGGLTSCSTGAPVCVDDPAALEPDGMTCGTDLVCDAGVCTACTAGVACTDNPALCLGGLTSCSTGSSVCLDNVAAPEPNGTICGSNQVCSAGACTLCTAGVACTTNPAPCLTGTTSCATGTETCVDTATPEPNGTSCGTDQVCNGGACAFCATGIACTTNPDPCHTGVTSCTTGTSVCVDSAAPEPDGTVCGTNQVCSGGACLACTAGVACADNPDPCLAGITSCTTGSPVCVDTVTPAQPGTICGTGQVCDGSGTCVACAAGDACTDNPDPCLTGLTSCATGSSVCLDNPALAEADGTSCGTDQVCSGGACVSCVAGAGCTPSNACHLGTVSCAGGPTCTDTGAAAADGTACGTGQTCDAGTCVASRFVTGTRLVTRWTAEAACTTAAPCRTTDPAPDVLDAQVEALVPDGAGAFRRYPGTFSADGSFSIPNVPAGSYLLVLVDGAGLLHVVETSASTVDLGYDVLGRQDLAPATFLTEVTLNVAGLEPWGGGHEIQIASASADLWDVPPVSGIALDQVSGTVVEDWHAPAVVRPLNLLDPADLLYVAQLPSYTATEGVEAYAYWRAAAAAAVPGVAMTDGTPATIDALIAPVTRTSTLAVDWRVTQFEALLAGMGPSAAPLPANPHELTVEAGAYALLDPVPEGSGGTPETFRMVRGAATPDVVVSTPIVYGQYADEALWSEWRAVSFTASVSYTATGATTPLEARASIGRREPMLPAPPAPIAPAVGTVEAPLVGGSPALAPIPAPTGLTPVVSWSPPAGSAPTSYRVAIHRLGVGAGGETTSTPVATWLVAGTSIQFPSDVLEVGREYYAEITAQARDAERFDVAPERAPRSRSHATTLTSPFKP